MVRGTIAAIVAVSGVALGGGSLAEAGDPSAPGELIVITQVIGADALGVAADLDFELYPLVAPDTYGSEMKATITSDSCLRNDSSLSGSFAMSIEGCELLAGSYRLGLTSVPEGFTAEVVCGDGFPFLGGGREVLEPGPGVAPDITVGGGAPQVTCFVLLFDAAPLTVDVFSSGVGHIEAHASVSVEAYEITETVGDPIIGPNVISDGTCAKRSEVVGGSSFFFGPARLASTTTAFDCALPEGSYQLGVDGLPAGYEMESVFCQPRNYPAFFGIVERIESSDALFDIVLDDEALDPYGSYCVIFTGAPSTLYLDAMVVGGTADITDFELEVFAGADGDLLSTVTDPSSEPCEPSTVPGVEFLVPEVAFDPASCAAVALPDGDYEIGATVPDYGYEVTGVECVALGYDLGFADERIGGDGAFAHPLPNLDDVNEPASRCTVVFTYVEQSVGASVTVDNAFGGDAVPSDFTIEVFELDGNTPGALVDSGPSPASFSLPIGNYVFGVAGPDGYAYSIDVSVDDVVSEALDPADASFSLARASTVSATLIASQTAPPTTTTTTTTTTTVAPTTTTTVAPTTAAPATATPTTATPITIRPTAQLPSTGSENSSIIWWAAALLLLGAGAMMTARRRSNMRW